MALGGRTLGKPLGHEYKTLINGISALIKETPESSLPFLPQRGPNHVRTEQEAVVYMDTDLPTPPYMSSVLTSPSLQL